MKIYQKLWHLLPESQQPVAIAMLGFMFAGMVIEMLGVGLMVPAVVLMTENDLVSKYPVVEPWLKRLGNPSQESLVIGGMLALVGVYAFKTLFLAFLTWRQAGFVSKIQYDDIDSIYKAAFECARTYSYGGGIGVDISSLRPKDSVVHNAADSSTGAVSFMELYSLTTGLIGQSGRRGALMLTIDVKHPDVQHFINVKKIPNWVTNQIVEQCSWSGMFSESELETIKKQVMENTQVRFANISIKASDEFMNAVDEERKYGQNKYLVYKKSHKKIINHAKQDEKTIHYFESLPYEILQYDEPFNFSKINNLAVSKAKGDYLLFLNDDTAALEPNWLTEMVSLCQQKNVGVVGPKLVHYDQTIQHAGAVFLKSGSGFHPLCKLTKYIWFSNRPSKQWEVFSCF